MPSKSVPYVVVVGVDYSETCTRALNAAFALAAQQVAAEPHIVHVAAPYENLPDGFTSVHVADAAKQLETYVKAQLASYAQQHPDQTGFDRVCTHLRIGAPAQQIVQLAVDLEADLVLVGTHSRRGVQRLLLGSVAESVVRMAPCPVLVSRPKALSDVPAIEPPCPRCLEAQRSSAGKQLWCAQHSERHGRRHTYHYVQRNMAEGNMPLVEPQARS
jgi:nucleotide-binding universal stress UspA family protein